MIKTNGNLIDTNIVSKLMNGDIAVIEIFDKLDNIHVSSITAGELFYGAFKSKRKDENMKLFKGFLSEYPVLKIDFLTAEIYGDVKATLVKKGINIPENDLWISAIAIQNHLSLFTMDKHFKNIDGLSLVDF